jgi:hypothetical protein
VVRRWSVRGERVAASKVDIKLNNFEKGRWGSVDLVGKRKAMGWCLDSSTHARRKVTDDDERHWKGGGGLGDQRKKKGPEWVDLGRLRWRIKEKPSGLPIGLG